MNSCCNSETSCSTSTTETPSAEPTRKPRFNISHTDGAFGVRVELPGVPKDGISVDLDKDLLTIVGKRSSPVPTDWKPLHRELSESSYRLNLHLQTPVDASALTARFDDGVLSLHLPLPEAAKPRRIQVN
jgi:HSP20 family protein